MGQQSYRLIDIRVLIPKIRAIVDTAPKGTAKQERFYQPAILERNIASIRDHT